MVRNGYQTKGDVVKKTTADGVDLNVVWKEIQEVTALWNEQQSNLSSLLSFKTTAAADTVPQNIVGDKFEVATEFGVPKATGRDTPLLVSYGFQDHDLASRWSIYALREMTFDQIRHSFVRALNADQNLVTGKILRRLFTPTQAISPEGNPVYGLYNGTDGMVPPPYMGRTFSSAESHYQVTSHATVDSGDVVDLCNLVTRKGFGAQQGGQLILLANPDAEGAKIQTWRAGVESRSGGPISPWDFIPSSSAPPYLTDKTIVGTTAPADYKGIPVAGSYGPTWLIESLLVPAGYIAVVATGGPNHTNNVIGFREHRDESWRNFRVVGSNSSYPIQEAIYGRSFGTGVRYRGAAAIAQCKASGSYDTPAISI